jgi:5-methylthioadenosine/S-adenosylhomocysteine deaminase
MTTQPELDLLIGGGVVITLDQDRRILDPGYIGVKHGKIAVVGVGASSLRSKEIIDARGMVILPGIVNAHNHLDQSLYRSCLDELRGSRQVLLRLARGMTRERARLAARLTLLEQVRYGVTTTHESHWTHFHADSTDGICEAVQESGMRAVVARSIMDGNEQVTHENERVPEETKETIEDVIQDLDRLERTFESTHIRITPEPITVLRVSADAIVAMHDWSLRKGKVWHIHLAQDPEELTEATRAFGCGSVQYVERLGVLGPQMVAAHCSGLLTEEIALLGGHGVRIAHCPETIMRAGGVVPPIWTLEELGAHVAIATDGSGTNNGQNPWEAMKHAVYMQRVRHSDRYLGTAEQALEMATIKAAKVLNLAEEVGSLEVGKCADIAIFRRQQVHLMPDARLVNNLVYSGGNNMADTVIVEGRIVLRDGRSTVFDEEEVMAQAREAQRRLIEEVGLSRQLRLSNSWSILNPGTEG